jgi:NADH-quinone oxidoreductase subunit A
MSSRREEYGALLVYFGVATVLARVVLGRSVRAATQSADAEKRSAYECGFNPFDDARSRFDIRFYLVSMLFIVFDVEAAYLFPWALTLGEQTSRGYRTIVDFVVELVVGFLYVWKMGALEWE